jgi:hypothetical protein
MNDISQKRRTERSDKAHWDNTKGAKASLKDMVAFALKATVATVPAIAILLFLYLVVMTVAGRL